MTAEVHTLRTHLDAQGAFESGYYEDLNFASLGFDVTALHTPALSVPCSHSDEVISDYGAG